MAHFDLSDINGVPFRGKSAYHGPAITAVQALHRNIIQFMSGSPIVDYNSLTYTPAGSPASGKVLAIDSRAGNQLGTGSGATVGKTPNQPQTWTLTFVNATQYNVTGSVDTGPYGPYNVQTDAIEADLFYFHVDTGVNPFVTGDTFTVSFVSNTNVDSTDQWVDPNPQLGYVDNTTEVPAYEERGSNADRILNFRAIYADLVGLSDPTDYIYMGIGAYDHNFDDAAGVQESSYTIFTQGLRGWDSTGSHPEPSSGRHTPMAANSTIFGHLMADKFHVKAVVNMASDYTYFYTGFMDSYCTSEEYAYPFLNIGTYQRKLSSWESSTYKFVNFAQAVSAANGIASAFSQEAYSEAGTWIRNDDTGIVGPTTISPFGSEAVTSKMYNNELLSAISPPRVGDNQILLVPTEVTNYVSGAAVLNGSSPNGVLSTRVYGQLRGVLAANANEVGEGTIITVSTVDYVCVSGKNSGADSQNNIHRAAFRLD